ncbi:MAG: hypothetical protein GY722_05800 [bacterium]|nr:hypothetical protein [bacterium]
MTRTLDSLALRTNQHTWLVVGYLIVAYLIVYRGLTDWISNADVNFLVVQPAIWLGLAALSYAGWRNLDGAPLTSRPWVITAVVSGVIYFGVLVFSGIIGNMATVRASFNLRVYVENTWYVGTLLLGIETARTYLYHAWKQRLPQLAAPIVVGLFFVAVTPYAQFTALDSVDRTVELIASSFVPALGISILATWFADRGAMGTSLAFRAPIVAYLWYSLVLPDLHWSTTLAVAVAATVLAYSLAGPLGHALTATEDG